MKNINVKKLLPHLIAVLVFVIVAIVYCKPSLEGKVLNQHDTQGWKGMAQQSFEVKEKTGHFPLWTNSMFGGMPTYQIALEPNTNIAVPLTYFTKVLSVGLPQPASFFFLACICFYLLCVIAGANAWVSVLGALAYAYATYNPIIIVVGHNTKMLAMAYAPAVLAGMLLIFQKKYVVGFALTALFSYIFISQNHLQIVYYTLIIAACMVVAFIVRSVKEGETAHAVKSVSLALVAGVIGLAACAVSILPTYEYARETMRGGVSQLTLDKDARTNKTKGGLDKDYALKWSMGKMETFTFMVPGLYGGSNGGNEHDASAKMVEKLTEIGVPEENALGMTNGYSYWGSMSSLSETTSGPPYLGAVICFLFILGLVYVKSWYKWWIVAASLIGIVLAWGSNFQAFNYFMLDYLPFYSKFRAPSMAMVIPQLCIPLLAVLAVSKLTEKETDWEEAWKKLRLSVMVTGAIVLLLGAFYFMADFTGKGDAQIKDNFKESMLRQVPPGQQPPAQLLTQANETSRSLMSALKEDRKSLMGGDLLRSILLIAVAVVLLGLFVRKKINATILTVALIVLSVFDLISVDKRYFGYDNFREAEELSDEFTPSPADVKILQDPDHANFRVFNQSPNFSQESLTSYHHNSIGGYSPAKLGLYQDLIEHQLGKGNMQVFDMLNTKYFIQQDQSGKQMAQLNPGAFGTCWLVKGIKYVNTANEEMLALDSTNLRDTAIVSIEFQKDIKQNPQYDSAAAIQLKQRQNDAISYSFKANTPQFAVFSEIYYTAGWNAYLDGQKTGYVKTNYALRGMPVPAGSHTIDFKFEPASYNTGRTITIWSTVLIYLAVIFALVLYFKKKD
ncbi:MAG: YfhO family protein [Ferruginibacter sp.]